MNPLKSQTEVTLALDEIPAELIAKTLTDALTATVVTRQGTREPDTRSRLTACQLILDRVLGKPIERQQIMTKTVNEGPDLIELAKSNPHVRDALRNQLDAMEAAVSMKTARPNRSEVE